MTLISKRLEDKPTSLHWLSTPQLLSVPATSWQASFSIHWPGKALSTSSISLPLTAKNLWAPSFKVKLRPHHFDRLLILPAETNLCATTACRVFIIVICLCLSSPVNCNWFHTRVPIFYVISAQHRAGVQKHRLISRSHSLLQTHVSLPLPFFKSEHQNGQTLPHSKYAPPCSGNHILWRPCPPAQLSFTDTFTLAPKEMEINTVISF